MFEEQGEPGYQPEQRLQEPGGFPGGAEADGDAGKPQSMATLMRWCP